MQPPRLPTTEERKNRKPRHRAVKDPTLVPNGVLLMQALNRYQKLTPNQMARLLTFLQKHSEDAAVKAIYEHPLFHARELGLIEGNRFYFKDGYVVAYNLTAKGSKWLEAYWKTQGINNKTRYTSETRNLTGGAQPNHWMKVKDGLIALEAGVKGEDQRLLAWHDYDQIKRILKPKGSWSQSIEPDGYLRFDDLVLLVEVDMGTEDSDAWESKTERYVQLLDHWEEDPFFAPYVEPLFIFFFPNERVMLKVKGWIQAAGGRGNFWLGTFDALDPRTICDYPFTVCTVKQPRTLSGKLLQTARQSA